MKQCVFILIVLTEGMTTDGLTRSDLKHENVEDVLVLHNMGFMKHHLVLNFTKDARSE